MDSSEQLSAHFKRAEFQCPCGCGLSAVQPALVVALEELRRKIGMPIRITSGFRCRSHNAAIGGSPASQHLTGRAADIAVAGWTGMDIYHAARGVPGFRGFGVAGGWAHLDVRPSSPARWKYDSSGRHHAWPMEKMTHHD